MPDNKPDNKRENPLATLLKSRGGFILICEAVLILGPEEYSRCLVDLILRDEKDPEYSDLFFQKGDSATGVPTHVCFSDTFMECLCEAIDNTLEQHGVISPRTKGVKVV